MQQHQPIHVAFLHQWGWENLEQSTISRMSESENGIINGVQFIDGNHRDDFHSFDYVIVGNEPMKDTEVQVAADKLWRIIGEPNTLHHFYLYKKRTEYARTYSYQPASGKARIACPTTPIWSVSKGIAFLRQTHPRKSKQLSWVTSNHAFIAGHRVRIDFLRRLQKTDIDFDLFGKGFNPIEDKWDGMADYKYSIAFENHRDNYYFSEKIGDCFVSETMPIYYGCKKITDYFPKNSLYVIDPDDKHVFAKIKEVINSDLYLENRDAILEAKELCLTKYNIFNFLASEINKHQAKQDKQDKQDIVIFNPYENEKYAFLINIIIVMTHIFKKPFMKPSVFDLIKEKGKYKLLKALFKRLFKR